MVDAVGRCGGKPLQGFTIRERAICFGVPTSLLTEKRGCARFSMLPRTQPGNGASQTACLTGPSVVRTPWASAFSALASVKIDSREGTSARASRMALAVPARPRRLGRIGVRDSRPYAR